MMHRIVNTRCFWYICSSPFTENSLWQFKLRVIFFDFLSWFLADNLSKELLMLDVSRFFSLQKTCVILKNIYQRKKCSNSTVYHCVRLASRCAYIQNPIQWVVQKNSFMVWCLIMLSSCPPFQGPKPWAQNIYSISCARNVVTMVFFLISKMARVAVNKHFSREKVVTQWEAMNGRLKNAFPVG